MTRKYDFSEDDIIRIEKKLSDYAQKFRCKYAFSNPISENDYQSISSYAMKNLARFTQVFPYQFPWITLKLLCEIWAHHANPDGKGECEKTIAIQLGYNDYKLPIWKEIPELIKTRLKLNTIRESGGNYYIRAKIELHTGLTEKTLKRILDYLKNEYICFNGINSANENHVLNQLNKLFISDNNFNCILPKYFIEAFKNETEIKLLAKWICTLIHAYQTNLDQIPDFCKRAFQDLKISKDKLLKPIQNNNPRFGIFLDVENANLLGVLPKNDFNKQKVLKAFNNQESKWKITSSEILIPLPNKVITWPFELFDIFDKQLLLSKILIFDGAGKLVVPQHSIMCDSNNCFWIISIDDSYQISEWDSSFELNYPWWGWNAYRTHVADNQQEINLPEPYNKTPIKTNAESTFQITLNGNFFTRKTEMQYFIGQFPVIEIKTNQYINPMVYVQVVADDYTTFVLSGTLTERESVWEWRLTDSNQIPHREFISINVRVFDISFEYSGFRELWFGWFPHLSIEVVPNKPLPAKSECQIQIHGNSEWLRLNSKLITDEGVKTPHYNETGVIWSLNTQSFAGHEVLELQYEQNNWINGFIKAPWFWITLWDNSGVLHEWGPEKPFQLNQIRKAYDQDAFSKIRLTSNYPMFFIISTNKKQFKCGTVPELESWINTSDLLNAENTIIACQLAEKPTETEIYQLIHNTAHEITWFNYIKKDLLYDTRYYYSENLEKQTNGN